MNKKIVLIALLFASCEFYGGFTKSAQSQTPQLPIMETQARIVQVENGAIEFTMDWGVNNAEVNGLTWYVYLNSSGRIDTAAKCAGEIAPFRCFMALPQLRFGNNIIQLSAARNGVESNKSTPLVVYYAWAEPPVVEQPPPPEPQRFMLCKPGTYRVQRITEGSKVPGAFNSAIGRVVYSYATATAVYVISCDMEAQEAIDVQN